jgi:glutathione S-transferase
MLAGGARRRNERWQASSLASLDFALQREGTLGARLQGHRPRAPRAAAGGPHVGRPLADPGRQHPGPDPPDRGRVADRLALEARYPQPPLYPADPEERRRALELEDFFDEQLGPAARTIAFYELINEPEIFAQVASEAVPGPLAKLPALTGLYASTYTSLRWKANDDQGAAQAREKIVAAMDVVDAELAAGNGEFLVGESFSVADLTAASLFYPVVGPDEGPLPPGQPVPPALERFREELSTRPAFNWVKETFRRHRHSHPPVSSAISG